MSPSPFILHKATWIFPISSHPVHDGIVVLKDGRIRQWGPSRSIVRAYAPPGGEAILVDHGQGVILPCLVNAHTHLELSCLSGQVFPGAGLSFLDWIRALIPARQKCGQDELKKGILSSINELLRTGTGLVGDVSNTGSTIQPLRKSALAGRIFLEAVGFNSQKEYENQQTISSILKSSPPDEDNVGLSLAAHAPYTVSAHYLRTLQQMVSPNTCPVSIHLAESQEESAFLLEGDDAVKSFLMERGQWDPEWVPPRMTPVRYLFEQGWLQAGTMCVHAVQVSDEDIDLMAGSHCSICICPRSNHNLGVGLPPVEKFLSRGIPVGLGTDSLASNTSLSLWEEMCFLKQAVPSLASSDILRMATVSGAFVLGREDFGGIEVGKGTPLIYVPLQASSAEEIMDMLVLRGREYPVTWISLPGMIS
ncbi:MAG: amidohydrolase family protein [bacterium]